MLAPGFFCQKCESPTVIRTTCERGVDPTEPQLIHVTVFLTCQDCRYETRTDITVPTSPDPKEQRNGEA
jgi:RNase P subunit RPR2